MSRWRWWMIWGGVYGTNSWSQRAKQQLWKMNLWEKVFLGVTGSILTVEMFLFVWNAFLCTSPPSLRKRRDGKEEKRGTVESSGGERRRKGIHRCLCKLLQSQVRKAGGRMHKGCESRGWRSALPELQWMCTLMQTWLGNQQQPWVHSQAS